LFDKEKERKSLRTENAVFINLIENDLRQNEKFLDEITDEKFIDELRDFEFRKETFKMNEKSFENRFLISRQSEKCSNRTSVEEKAKRVKSPSLRRRPGHSTLKGTERRHYPRGKKTDRFRRAKFKARAFGSARAKIQGKHNVEIRPIAAEGVFRGSDVQGELGAGFEVIQEFGA
jgi:hypothetical protein